MAIDRSGGGAMFVLVGLPPLVELDLLGPLNVSELATFQTNLFPRIAHPIA
jgi:hypothetical protein